MKQKIAIQVEAGHETGFGHLKRCLVLARKLKKNAEINFITQSKEVFTQVSKEKFKVFLLNKKKSFLNQIKQVLLKQKVDKIIIDLKEKVNKSYINSLKKIRVKTILLDNIGSGRLNADIVIYPVAHFNKKYFKGIRGKLYYGWDYVIIDKKFFNERKKEGKIPKILVSLGGSDIGNLTPKIINALTDTKFKFKCTIVIGPGFKTQNIKIDDKRCIIKKNVKNMAELMLSHDLGIILFGVSAYEAIAARLPRMILIADERNIKSQKRFCKKIKATNLGEGKKVNVRVLVKKTKELLSNKGFQSNKFLPRKQLIFGVI